MKAFDYDNYKDFVRERLLTYPKKGHGEFRKIAQALGIHTTMVTHVFKGESNLSLEQTLKLSKFFGMSEMETEYLVMLVQFERAGDQLAKQFCRRQLAKLKERSQNLSERLEIKNTLDERDQALFYSNWLNVAIRLLSDIPQYQSAAAVSQRLDLPLDRINRSLEFLISRGLVTEENGVLNYGAVKTYAQRDSALVSRHHTNWRLKVIEQIDDVQNSELAFTFPCVLSEKDFGKIKEKLVAMIEEIQKTVMASDSENLYCLTMDWMKVRPT